ncbi:MAG TPA: YkgJ family cysteine cluster protein [Thermoanaerobaculia bacterium]|nr:YkgJ family cysteine cluster protein [Thermoanaerobaculia bacterium]
MSGSNYRDLLSRADEFFADIVRQQPQNLQCGRGCSLCCYGLFEISAADVPVIAEGLARLRTAARRAVIQRALGLVDSGHPNLRECSPDEKEAFFDRTASVACPALNAEGECLIYDERPLVCRTFGLPLRNGDEFIGDVCELNFQESPKEDLEAAAWDLQWEDVLGPDDEYTIPEAIVLAARLRGWL